MVLAGKSNPKPDYLMSSLLQRKTTIISQKTTKDISLLPISIMFLEAVRRYIDHPKNIAKGSKTLDIALAPAFAVLFPPGTNYISKVKDALQYYDNNPLTTSVTFAGQPVKTYFGKRPTEITFSQLMKELYSAEELTPIYSEAGTIPGPTMECHKQIIASLDGIECKDPEEIQIPLNPLTAAAFEATSSGDEIYFMTQGVLYSKRVKLDSSLHLSPITEHVGTKKGHKKLIDIPGNMKFPIYCDVNKSTIDPKGLPSLNMIYSFTLFEHEHSDEARRQALLNAVKDGVEALQALCGLDPIGFCINVGQLIYDLAIALDDDDILGNRSFRFGNLESYSAGTRDTTVTFSGSHYSNNYEYIMKSHFTVNDLPH